MPSPMAHISGLSERGHDPRRRRVDVILMARWDADAAIELIERHGCQRS